MPLLHVPFFISKKLCTYSMKDIEKLGLPVRMSLSTLNGFQKRKKLRLFQFILFSTTKCVMLWRSKVASYASGILIIYCDVKLYHYCTYLRISFLTVHSFSLNQFIKKIKFTVTTTTYTVCTVHIVTLQY